MKKGNIVQLQHSFNYMDSNLSYRPPYGFLSPQMNPSHNINDKFMNTQSAQWDKVAMTSKEKLM